MLTAPNIHAGLDRIIDNEIGALQETSASLEDIMDHLRALQVNTHTRMDKLKRRRRVLQNAQGLNKIPNEVLSHIMSFTISPLKEEELGRPDTLRQVAPRMEDVVALSHVNRRFLHVARGTQTLWTVLTRLEPLDMVETFLSRSGMRALQVVQVFFKGGIQLAHEYGQSLQVVWRHASRLEVLRLRPAGGEHQEEIYSFIYSAPQLEFPRLVNLGFICPSRRWTDKPDPPSYGAILGARFPSLRSLDMPDFMLDLPVIKNLTSLHLHGRDELVDRDRLFTVDSFLTALTKLPDLLSLSLDIDYSTDSAVVFRDATLPPVIVPAIVDLKFRTSEKTANIVVANILHHASFPNLQTLDLDLRTPYRQADAEETDGLLEAVYALGRDHHSFPQLHKVSLARVATLHVDIPDCLHPLDANADWKMLSRMPALRELSLYHTIPPCTLSRLRADEDCLLPLLECIGLHQCAYVRADDIADVIWARNGLCDLLNATAARRVGPHKKLVVTGCSRINREDYDSMAKLMKGYGSLEVDYYDVVLHEV